MGLPSVVLANVNNQYWVGGSSYLECSPTSVVSILPPWSVSSRQRDPLRVGKRCADQRLGVNPAPAHH